MEQQAEHLLQLNHLTTCFKTDRGTLPAVDDVSWYVDKGEIVAMVGESGSGKPSAACPSSTWPARGKTCRYPAASSWTAGSW